MANRAGGLPAFGNEIRNSPELILPHPRDEKKRPCFLLSQRERQAGRRPRLARNGCKSRPMMPTSSPQRLCLPNPAPYLSQLETVSTRIRLRQSKFINVPTISHKTIGLLLLLLLLGSTSSFAVNHQCTPYMKPIIDQREICQYCKNQDTQRVIDPYDIKPYAEYHKWKPFKVFYCFCCKATWHFKCKQEEI